MPEEYPIYGIYVPTLLVMALLAYVLMQILDVVLTRWNLYRFVWHPPLFNLALYTLVLGALFYVHRII